MTVTGFRLHTDFSALKHFLLAQRPPVVPNKPGGSRAQRRRVGLCLCPRVVLPLELENAGGAWIFGYNFIYSLDGCQLPQGHQSNADLEKSHFMLGSCRSQI